MQNRPNHPHLQANLRGERDYRAPAPAGTPSPDLDAQSTFSEPGLLDEATYEEAEARLPDVTGDDQIDVLLPWGSGGPAPVGRWRADMLGPDFESRTLPLAPDDEGEVVATLVRKCAPQDQRRQEVWAAWQRLFGHRPTAKESADTQRFVLLFIHGRNDYFFHTEAADAFAEMGGAFYALDLRKYGRSLRPWQTIGYTDDLRVYDEEINAALDLIREEHPDLPIFVFGHSTGGLIATLWSWRHPGAIAGLILNSAWLELQVHSRIRGGLQKVAESLAQVRPRAQMVGVSKSDVYFRTLSDGWSKSGLEVPEYFTADSKDPAFVGWQIWPEWKRPFSYPAPAAWIAAVLEGQGDVENRVHLDCPVLAMASTRFGSEEVWDSSVFNSDIVLDADLITDRAAGLSDSVVIARFPGKHDLLLSDPPVREDVYATIRRWFDYLGADRD